jgi:hypothetical protein
LLISVTATSIIPIHTRQTHKSKPRLLPEDALHPT